MRCKGLLVTFVTLAFLGLLVQPASAGHGAIEIEVTWGDHDEWELLAPKFPVKAVHASHAPLYVIGAVTAATPQSMGHDSDIGPHDHVVAVPPRNRGSYSAIWHVFVVVLGPGAIPGVNVNFRLVDTFLGPAPLVFEADLGAGLHPLKTAGEVESAEGLGLVTFVDIGIVFVCPIRPMKG
ncbi:MAG: hypothetical protein ACE5LS_05030 [Thermoplasmata archaeon]